MTTTLSQSIKQIVSCRCSNIFTTKRPNPPGTPAIRWLHLLHKKLFPRIRATYTTRSHQYKLDPVFLNSHDPPADVKRENAQFPPILFVTPENFTPSLLPSDLEKIDNLLARGGGSPSIPTSLRKEVTGSKETRPHVSAAWKQRNPRQCACCEKHGEKSLSVCSRCVTYSFHSSFVSRDLGLIFLFLGAN
jgi:hypothetical protein